MDRPRKRGTSRRTATVSGRAAPIDVEAFLRLERSCAALGRLLPRPQLTAAARARLRTRWGRHLVTLTPLLADVIEAEPELLAPLGLSGAGLRERTARVRRLAALRALFHDLEERVLDLLLLEKSALFDDSQQLLQELKLALHSRLLAPAASARLAAAAAPALRLLETRQAEITKKRRQQARLRAAAGERAPEVTGRPPAGPEAMAMAEEIAPRALPAGADQNDSAIVPRSPGSGGEGRRP